MCDNYTGNGLKSTNRKSPRKRKPKTFSNCFHDIQSRNAKQVVSRRVALVVSCHLVDHRPQRAFSTTAQEKRSSFSLYLVWMHKVTKCRVDIRPTVTVCFCWCSRKVSQTLFASNNEQQITNSMQENATKQAILGSIIGFGFLMIGFTVFVL